MKAVYVVDKSEVAMVLIDPMRRAILDLLRAGPMTQAQLAKDLGLAAASLNHHIRILKSKRLVVIERKEREKHRILQIFFSPAAYLFVYDSNSLPKSVARYFYPLSLERTRGVISSLRLLDQAKMQLDSQITNALAEKLSQSLVEVARKYESKEVGYGLEEIVYEMYTKALKKIAHEIT